ncbi:MAG: carbohydrate-binding family 9-like protein [Clostridia bacterium]|nr:carbohydrate-binding family 9-like protein [Clostridia bacterium]
MKANHRVKEPIIPCDPPVCRCVRAEGKPGPLDGDLTKPFWQRGEWLEEFHDIEGDSLPRPWKKTRVKVLWDEEALYVGAELSDDTIWATVTERDDVIFADNDFEVFLAPQQSGHRYYELELNALNTVWDLYMERPQRDRVRRINSWDIRGLETAVKIDGRLNDPTADNRGWSVEMKLPWYSFRESEADSVRPSHFAPVPGEVWRMDFSRVEYEVDIVGGKYVKRKGPDGRPLPEHNWLWAPTGVIDAHMPEMWGYLVFTENGEDWPLPEEDEIRFALRRLYYREHIHACRTGRFTDDVRSLIGLEADRYGIRVAVTPSLFEGYAAWKGTLWHIDQDGYIWEGEER